MKPAHGKRLQWFMLALGVIAFAVIVTDRVREAFQADEPPEAQSTVAEQDEPMTASPTQSAASEQQVTVVDTTMDDSVTTLSPGSLALPDAEALVTLENLFGSPVVLVSAAEPSYVMTADEKRFDVGGVIDDETTLAGITGHQLIFEQSGDLMVISLPEPEPVTR